MRANARRARSCLGAAVCGVGEPRTKVQVGDRIALASGWRYACMQCKIAKLAAAIRYRDREARKAFRSPESMRMARLRVRMGRRRCGV